MIDPLTVKQLAEQHRLREEARRQLALAALMTGPAPQPQPPDSAPQPKKTPQGGAKRQRILQAYKELWPNGPPVGLTPGERNKQIADWLTARELEVPSPKTFERAFAR